MPLAWSLDGMVPRTPQTTAVASNTAQPSSATQPLASATRINVCSCSGEASRSSTAWRKTLLSANRASLRARPDVEHFGERRFDLVLFGRHLAGFESQPSESDRVTQVIGDLAELGSDQVLLGEDQIE